MEDNIKDSSQFVRESDLVGETIDIKAIGVGGGGNNAVDHMYEKKIQGVSFANINTDKQALANSKVPITLQIGPGLGAGDKPEVGRAYAEDNIDKISKLFEDDTKMVFITAGMGGGTGTGAAPVVARVAKERGLLTIGIVTIPFLFEGSKKILKALDGADEMAKYVDALLVINNERLNEIYGDQDFLNAFRKADDILSIAAKSISDIITHSGPGEMNLDFKDVDTTLRDGGAAIISSGYGEGEDRVTKAIEEALRSPLLKNRDIQGSKKLLFHLSFNPEAKDRFQMSESMALTEFVQSINKDVNVIWGFGCDESLGDAVKITILAAGFDITLSEEEDKIEEEDRAKRRKIQIPTRNQPKEPSAAEVDKGKERMKQEYGKENVAILEGKERGATVVLASNQLDDDEVCEALEHTPAYKRSKQEAEKIKLMGTPIPDDDPTPSSGRTIKF